MLKINQFPPHHYTPPNIYPTRPPSAGPIYSWKTPLNPTSDVVSSDYYADPVSRRKNLIHFIISLASSITGLVFGICALATPHRTDSLIVWMVITETAALVGGINSSYVMCKGMVFDMKTLGTACITLLFSLGWAIIIFLTSSLKN